MMQMVAMAHAHHSFADWAIAFNQALGFGDQPRALAAALPTGYRVMNPFTDGQALAISSDFYRRFYADAQRRRIIFGINPGRHGAGLTGVPFTDSKQLAVLGIDARGIRSFELSAAFIYRMIERFGGAAAFYRAYYINSPLPLGLLRLNAAGTLVNANYYDSAALRSSAAPFIDYALDQYRRMPIDTAVAYCLGLGQNYRYLQRWNGRRQLFGRIVPLAHPRYIMQYRSKLIEQYIDDYLSAFRHDSE